MIDSLWTYFAEEVVPRYPRILFTSHPWVAATVALAVAADIAPVAEKTNFFEIASPLLTYDTVVIGFCVTAMAICFSFSKRFSSVLCKIKIGKFSAYEDLIFVFSWTSFIHMFASLIIIVIYAAIGDFNIYNVVKNGFSFQVFLFFFVQIYSILQFFITIVTVHQVAKLYAKQVSVEG